MSDREKLIELINEARRMCEDADREDCTHNEDIFCTRSIIADHLISNGVTVQKPINTNADCIRNMNDDVLMVAISQVIIKEVESALRSEGKVPTATGLAFLCAGVRDRVEMWLRQECK